MRPCAVQRGIGVALSGMGELDADLSDDPHDDEDEDEADDDALDFTCGDRCSLHRESATDEPGRGAHA